jgi:hypothetical protein
VRGSLSQELMDRFKLRDGVDPQKFGIGLKELWQVDPAKHQPGLVVHSQGWPLDSKTGGGSFQYHYTNEQGDKLVSVGFVVHLNYENPHLSPFDEFQRFKTHPAIRPFVRGRQASRVRRARDQRRRTAIGAETDVPRRRADRLRRGLPQRAADQGLAQCDEVRDAGRRGRLRGGAGGTAVRRAGRVQRELEELVDLAGPVQGSQRQAVAEVGDVAGHDAGRDAHVAERPRHGQACRVDDASHEGGP